MSAFAMNGVMPREVALLTIPQLELIGSSKNGDSLVWHKGLANYETWRARNF